VSAGACRNCPGLDEPVSSDSLFGGPKLEKLDWSGIGGLISLQPGTKLRLINLHLHNFAYKTAYQYSPQTPFLSVGVGMSVWPTVNLGPNTTFVGLNITASYVNPSGEDDCPRYVEKSLSFLIQVTTHSTPWLVLGGQSVVQHRLWDVPPVECHMLPASGLQACSQDQASILVPNAVVLSGARPHVTLHVLWAVTQLVCALLLFVVPNQYDQLTVVILLSCCVLLRSRMAPAMCRLSTPPVP
jgi:hypothetical protein